MLWLGLLMSYFFFYKYPNKINAGLIILGASLLNFFKIPPPGDYISYVELYYRLSEYSSSKFIQFISAEWQKDYIFYILMYISNKLKIGYSGWAFIINFIFYIFIFKIYKLLPNKNKKMNFLFLLFFNPFFISRSILAIIICIYGMLILNKKNKKTGYIFILLAVLTHVSVLIIPIVYIIHKFFKKFIIEKNKYILLYLFFSIMLGVILKKNIQNMIIKFNISKTYLESDFVFQYLSLNGKLKSLLTNYSIIILLILLCFIVKNKKVKNFNIYSLIIVISLLIISPILGRRIAWLLIPYCYILSMYSNFENKKLKIYIILYFLIITISGQRDYLLPAYRMKSYPFYYRIMTKELFKKIYIINSFKRDVREEE